MRNRIAIAVSCAVLAVALLPALAQAAPLANLDLPLVPQRIGGENRYATSAEAAKAAYPGWAGVDHVVVAGTGRGAADALSASGLSWLYDAPLLLVATDRLPPETADAIAEAVSVSGAVQVHVVGGPASVPDERLDEIRAIVGVSAVERVSGPDRYSTARAVALEMAAEAPGRGKSLPGVVLLANGSEPKRLADALVLSAITARTGAPLLLVSGTAVPPVTSLALSEVPSATRYVAGGTLAVGDGIVSALGATRIAGGDRYGTAAEVARVARSRGWLDGGPIVLASGMADALSGAPLAARRDAPLLLTATEDLPLGTASYLVTNRASINGLAILGGEAVVSNAVYWQLQGAPARPKFTVTDAGTGIVGPKAAVRVTTGVNAKRVRVLVNGAQVAVRDVSPYSTVEMGALPMPPGTDRIRVVIDSFTGGYSEAEQTFTNLGYSWDTFIVIDKSEFQLYWVRHGILRAVYPVATGRTTAETPTRTWKINSKYYTDPSSVYGPRKMRLYAQVSGGYTYTRYAIHGTNQPWVIGTKASAGCIRMYNHDVLELFPQVPLGTMVVTRQ